MQLLERGILIELRYYRTSMQSTTGRVLNLRNYATKILVLKIVESDTKSELFEKFRDGYTSINQHNNKPFITEFNPFTTKF